MCRNTKSRASLLLSWTENLLVGNTTPTKPAHTCAPHNTSYRKLISDVVCRGTIDVQGSLTHEIIDVPNFLFSGPPMVCRTTFFFPNFFFIPKKCLYENWRAPPPLMWWISIFLISWCKGIALLNNLMPFFCNRRKIERFFFSKKKSEMVENWNISESRGGGSFFWNCVNRSIFIRFQNGRDQIVWKSNPLIEKIIKKYIYI